MKITTKIVACLVSLGASGAVFAQASPQTNEMTNIATVQAGCDIAAIGIDFGFVPSATGGGQTSANANTSAGNTVTGNSAHPDRAADGEAEDDLAFSGALGTLLNASIGTVFNATADLVPGVYVVCSVTPDEVTVTNSDGTETVLFNGTAVTANATLAGEMDSADDSLTYSAAFSGLALDLGILGAFAASYTAVGTIDADQTANPGFYTEVWEASVEF